jgi:putative endonuclease
VAQKQETQTCNTAKTWNTYIVKCNDGTLYTGITTDLTRRLKEHNYDPVNGKTGRGAAYTRSRRPVKLVYSETQKDRRQASRREHEVKKMSREAKMQLITSS